MRRGAGAAKATLPVASCMLLVRIEKSGARLEIIFHRDQLVLKCKSTCALTFHVEQMYLRNWPLSEKANHADPTPCLSHLNEHNTSCRFLLKRNLGTPLTSTATQLKLFRSTRTPMQERSSSTLRRMQRSPRSADIGATPTPCQRPESHASRAVPARQYGQNRQWPKSPGAISTQRACVRQQVTATSTAQ